MNNQLIVTSPAFKNEEIIPIEYTGRGEDISPELHLSATYESAKSVTIIMDDLSHPIPKYNHWVIWNLPVMQIIPGKIPHGEIVAELDSAVQGKGYGKNCYRGPKPPFNLSHRYQFDVYVLDCLLDLPSSTKKRHLIKAMDGHILQKGSLVGRFR